MSLPLVYHPDYVTPLPDGHPFPMPKFGRIYVHLLQSGLAGLEQFHFPTRADAATLALAHAPDYIAAFQSGTLDRKAMRRIGLPWSQALVTRTRLAQLRTIAPPVGPAVIGMLEFFNRFDTKKYGSEGAPLHDPCTIAYLLRPELFEGKLCNVEIETGSPLTLGHTAVDFWGVTNRQKNVNWLHRIDADGYFDLLVEKLNP